MNSPFQYGKVVEGDAFTNRKKELKWLLSNFDNNINTTLLSPRRWGKSSLVRRAAKTAANGKIFCFIDLFNVRNETEFYSLYIKQVLKASYGKTQELLSAAKTILSKIKPKFTIPIDSKTDFQVQLDLDIVKQSYDEILNLPEKLSQKKKKKIIVCIDEFQNIEYFDDPLLFQKRLRSAWQYHKNAAYCIYGSKKHMMMNLFDNPSMPFYKFGDVIYLDKISEEDFVPFIIKNFNITNKKIDTEFAKQIVKLMDCHPYYVQQLSHIIWINTVIKVTQDIIDKSIENLLEQNSSLYENEYEDISNSQINFLKAIMGDNNGGLSSMETIKKYNLGTSANVAKIKSALLRKELIDTRGSRVFILDPVFALWLKRRII